MFLCTPQGAVQSTFYSQKQTWIIKNTPHRTLDNVYKPLS